MMNQTGKALQEMLAYAKANGLSTKEISEEIARREAIGLEESGIGVDRSYDKGYFWRNVKVGEKKIPYNHPAVDCILANTNKFLVNVSNL